MPQNIGVVQGSKTGPLLFDIYSRDFDNIFENENILYADDTCLIYVGNDLARLVLHINARLRVVNDWCRANKLALNTRKCEFMLVTNKKLAYEPELVLNNCPLKRVSEFKYL